MHARRDAGRHLGPEDALVILVLELDVDGFQAIALAARKVEADVIDLVGVGVVGTPVGAAVARDPERAGAARVWHVPEDQGHLARVVALVVLDQRVVGRPRLGSPDRERPACDDDPGGKGDEASTQRAQAHVPLLQLCDRGA